MNESVCQIESVFCHYSPQQWFFGVGAIEQLPRIVSERRAARILLISDRSLVSAGLVSKVLAVLHACEGVSVFQFLDGAVEPGVQEVEALASLAEEHLPDLFLALGGGSNMDLAKAALAAYRYDKPPETFFGFNLVPNPLDALRRAVLVCIPTTAGTGSEATHVSVIKQANGQKAAIVSQGIRPEIALVDPSLTVSCPRKVTAETGLDALTHAIEALLVKPSQCFESSLEGLPYEGSHEIGALYANRAIELIGEHFLRVIEKPDALESRCAMSMAATLAGSAFSSCGVSLVHALEYNIGNRFPISHGEGNALLLPAVLEFWRSSTLEKQAGIAERLLPANELRGASREAKAVHLAEHVKKLRRNSGLPNSLSEIGCQEADLRALAEPTLKMQRLLELSPRPIGGIEDLVSILQNAM